MATFVNSLFVKHLRENIARRQNSLNSNMSFVSIHFNLCIQTSSSSTSLAANYLPISPQE